MQFTGGHVTVTVTQTGFVALLDVLGFRGIVANDRDNKQVTQYLRIVGDLLRQAQGMDGLIFSDSIVLTRSGSTPEDLRLVCEFCSNLMFELLKADIVLRGAIAFGDYISSNLPNSRFIAGKPIVEAEGCERRQDWIGVMLAPSAITQVEAAMLSEECDFLWSANIPEADIGKNLLWKAYLQRCRRIPMHSDSGKELHDGFAIVPGGALNFDTLRQNIQSTIAHLHGLKLAAATPAYQQKYGATTDWLIDLSAAWSRAAARYGNGVPASGAT